jgi:hypothetical protein
MAPRRLNWSEAFSRAQWAPAKGPSLLNQRLGITHGGTGEARGAGGWVPDPPGHAKPGYALCSGQWVRLAAGGERAVITRWWEPPPGAGPCADPRGNSPEIWLAGGGQGPFFFAIYPALRASSL